MSKHVELKLAALSLTFWGISFQIIKQKIENMKVDRTKLKKTPTEAVSIQKFACFFISEKNLCRQFTHIDLPNISSLIHTQCSKTATCLETVKFSFELPLVKKVNKLVISGE